MADKKEKGDEVHAIRRRAPSIGMVALLVIAMLSARSATAWSYPEHVQISLDGFELACKNRYGEQQPAICTKAVRLCYAHMVALAGDHTRSPGELVAPAKGLLEDRETSVYCADVDRVLVDAQLSASTPPEELRKATRSGVGGVVDYLSLLTDNAAHFMPGAHEQWPRHLRTSLNGDFETAHERLSHHAFASHFLQDSFAAGHHGLDRGEQRQDLDQAFHDDFNGTGVFLSNERGDSWHTYGDEYLDKPTWLLRASPCGQLSEVELLERLSTAIGEAFEEIREEAYQTACRSSGLQVLSLTRSDYFSIMRPCFYWDNCDKVEVIMGVPHEWTAQDLEAMKCEDSDDPALLVCDGNHSNVVEAMARSLDLLFDSLQSDRRRRQALEAQIGEIEELVPTSFRTVAYRDGNSTINKSSQVLAIGPQRDALDVREYPKRDFRQWHVGVHWRNGDESLLSDTTFFWGLRPRQTEKHPWAFDLRFDILSDDGSILDGFEVGGGFELFRWPYNIVGGQLRGSVGVDDVWGGRTDRNWYYGVGLELDAHLGKHIVFLDVSRTRHNGSFIDNEDQLRVMIGWRVASVALSGRKRD